MSTPAFYDDPGEVLAEAWRLMARGVADRRSPFHHPVVATTGQDGRPQLRTVILRACDVPSRTLRFHTDVRSEKIAEIARDNRIGLHFYDPGAKIQLRIGGIATVHMHDAVADAAWAGSRPFSRQCYGIEPGPGTPILLGAAFDLPDVSDQDTSAGRAHFAAVTVELSDIEWLYLAAQGHRRARFTWPDAMVQAQWLVP
jgi:pyridoxamine 5'-phosphate oxidase